MGNNPSHPKSPAPSSPSPSSHDSTQQKPHSRRGDPRNLIHSQRSGASAEPSLAQARGTTTATHRPRVSQSNPIAHLEKPSPGQSTQPSPQGSDYQVSLGAQLSREKSEARDIPSKPVDVPAYAQTDFFSEKSNSPPVESGPTVSDMSYHLSRPPRLPLPIAEEVHTPGSPILAPTDAGAPLEEDVEALEGENTLPRRSSALSSTTVDEEDAEELKIDKTGLTVPTTFEWREGGERIYVTGSIFDWNTKRRLYKVEGEPGLFRGVVNIRPGTHHVRFLVDNVTKCSTNLPTTVDFGNNLVNYIEVSADDLPKPESDVKDDSTPSTTAVKDHAIPSKSDATQPSSTTEQETLAKPAPKTKPARPAAKYTSSVPQYLIDLDKAEDSVAYQAAASAIEKLPTPPSLPGFLGKPILNAATPMKDDNSVLIMPNHTVLNHLATSSIKNNVLAVSATTRYKRKYVTTIMYKPTGADA